MMPTEVIGSSGLSPRLAATLAYAGWWVTGLLIWIVEQQDRYIRFHAAQAVAAFGVIATLILAFAGLALASLSFLPRAFTAFMWAAVATWALGLVLWVVAMWKAATGHTWRIPVAADLADRLM